MQELSLSELDAIRQEGLRPGVVGVFIHDEKVLFLFKQKYKLWGFSQGGVDNGEEPQIALWREMTEELGEDFVAGCNKEVELLGYDQIDFPPARRGVRDLQTDDGKDVYMNGKFYLFYMINCKQPDIDMTKTEFDDYQWNSYDEAIEMAESIYQRGKRRLTLRVLSMLREKDII